MPNPYKNNHYPRRGEIYYIKKGNSTSTGAETWSNRHAVIVSSNHINKFSDVVQVVYITTQDKQNIPTHVNISTKYIHRIALCEQITAIDKSRIAEYKGCLNENQMKRIDRALTWNLNLLKYVREYVGLSMMSYKSFKKFRRQLNKH